MKQDEKKSTLILRKTGLRELNKEEVSQVAGAVVRGEHCEDRQRPTDGFCVSQIGNCWCY